MAIRPPDAANRGHTIPRTSRHRARLRVVSPRGIWFTANVSTGGFCTALMRVLPVGTRIEGTVHFDGNDEPFVGRVAWARRGDPRMNLMGTMGVSFEKLSPGLGQGLFRLEGEAGPSSGHGA
jgi:hypothetical protein